MGLPRDIVELAVSLRRDASVDVFGSAADGGFASKPQFQSALAKLASAQFSGPEAALRLCLQALAIQHDELEPKILDAELVATIPVDSPGIARPTERVIREMLGQSTEELIVLGYEFTDPEMIGLIASACSRGVEAIMICDRGKGAADRILSAWPKGIREPRLYLDRVRPDAGPYASMHAKCLLVDGSNLLVTSANFTFHGMQKNIEVGVRLSGWPANEARKIFSYLVENQLVGERLAR
jgi:phosphatidylserine/phosphatidylglycerophosphate/cardiolipin synthase-like enzyme